MKEYICNERTRNKNCEREKKRKITKNEKCVEMKWSRKWNEKEVNWKKNEKKGSKNVDNFILTFFFFSLLLSHSSSLSRCFRPFLLLLSLWKEIEKRMYQNVSNFNNLYRFPTKLEWRKRSENSKGWKRKFWENSS